jgi:dephospho-CoA kinase
MGTGGNLIVGLTGGMGCGKSTVAAFFATEGFVRLDADQVVRDVLLTDAAVEAAIRGRFGADVFAADGRVDRARLGAVVFVDDAALAWLEALLHPRLQGHWERVYAAARGERFIVEVPLLYEKGLEKKFDFTVCVSTTSAQQLQRLEQRGVPPGIARQRLAKQLPLARKCELADFVLLNDGSLDFLRDQVRELARRLPFPLPTAERHLHGPASEVRRGH